MIMLLIKRGMVSLLSEYLFILIRHTIFPCVFKMEMFCFTTITSKNNDNG